MIGSYFDQIYLINLDRRMDRLERASEECGKYGIQFRRISAVDGNAFDDYVRYDPVTTKRLRWSSGAAALVKTTRIILEDAIQKSYDRILILEDDVEFHPKVNEIFNQYYQDIPNDWEMLYFGVIHTKRFEMISTHIAKVHAAFCCHCYAIKSSMFNYMLELTKVIEKPIDQYTMDHIQPRGKSYCFVPNLAYQRPEYSDIGMACVYHPALRYPEVQKAYIQP